MNLCQDYLATRGISDATVKLYSLELDDRLDPNIVKVRLGRGCPKGTLEILWCPLFDAQGTVYSYTARILPTIANTPKFLCPINSGGPPYVPKTVRDLALGQPVIITEGPIKALACVQAGCAATA